MADVVGDAELITAARAGNEQAYAELYRRHASSALRFACALAGRSDAEDLVADAFARVLAALRSGNGPAGAFRPYLLSAVRNAFYDNARRLAREQPLDEVTPPSRTAPVSDPALTAEEHRLVAAAFRSLPERWQVVLWHTEVEGERAAEVAPVLGISPNAVAALAYRAREGLRERYLQAHIGSAIDRRCRPVVDRLGAYTRNKLSLADAARVRAHLDECDRCRLLFVELADVNARLGALLGPIVLGGAAAAYLATVKTAGGAAAVGAGAATGGASLFRWLDQLPHAQIGAGAVVAAGIATLALAFVSSPVPGGEGTQAAAPTALPSPPSTVVVSTAPSVATGPSVGSSTALTEPASAPTEPASPSRDASLPGVAARPENPASRAATVGLSVTLEPVGTLVRGRPGLLRLTVTTSDAKRFSTTALTAIISLPTGVTLRVANAGHGWTCSGVGSIVICIRDHPVSHKTTHADIHVSVAADAAEGLPSVQVSALGALPVTAVASAGVV